VSGERITVVPEDALDAAPALRMIVEVRDRGRQWAVGVPELSFDVDVVNTPAVLDEVVRLAVRHVESQLHLVLTDLAGAFGDGEPANRAERRFIERHSRGRRR
jgi:hypothetical protein